MKDHTVTLTSEQMKDLSSLLSVICGSLQYRAIGNPKLDDEWSKWHAIKKQVNSAHGFESFMEPERIKNLELP